MEKSQFSPPTFFIEWVKTFGDLMTDNFSRIESASRLPFPLVPDFDGVDELTKLDVDTQSSRAQVTHTHQCAKTFKAGVGGCHD